MAKDKLKKAAKLFAADVYVYVCDYDGDEPILAVTDDPSVIDDGAQCARYSLEQVLGEAKQTTLTSFPNVE